MEKPAVNQEIELTIGSLAFGGRGVARRDGFVIFVDGALPGDVVRAVVTKAKRSYAEARTREVLSPSVDRIQPACRHFGVCGGCSWQTLSYETQLDFKQRQVVECLEHIGGLSGFEVDAALGAGQQWRYRNKVEFSFAAGSDGSSADSASPGGLVLGFHLPGEWRRVMDVEDCLLHSEYTNRIRNRVRELAAASGAGVYDQRSEGGFWRHLVIREAAGTGEILVNLVTAPGEFPDAERFTGELTAGFPRIKSLVWSINATKASVASGFPFTVLSGRDHIVEKLGGLELSIAPSTFLQTNTAMAERLYQRAMDYAQPQSDEFVLDLYSGIGSIALFFAGHCRRVTGVEISEDAVRMAQENVRRNGIGNTEFHAGKVRSVLKELDMGERPDLVMLDPPRAGASRKEIRRIIELEPERVVYVSCNASTMASNAAELAEAGYRLAKVGAVDMFPQTPHIEAVAAFTREGGGGAAASPPDPANKP